MLRKSSQFYLGLSGFGGKLKILKMNLDQLLEKGQHELINTDYHQAEQTFKKGFKSAWPKKSIYSYSF